MEIFFNGFLTVTGADYLPDNFAEKDIVLRLAPSQHSCFCVLRQAVAELVINPQPPETIRYVIHRVRVKDQRRITDSIRHARDFGHSHRTTYRQSL